MNPVAYVDLVGVLACVIAVAFLIRGHKGSGFSPAIPILLAVLLALMIYYQVALFLEWSGITTGMDWLEDFSGVFIPFTWAFVFYAFVKNAVEDELRASRERFKALTESTSDWIWECDRHGAFTYSSPQVQYQLGYTVQEMLGRQMFDYMTAPSDEQFRAKFTGAVSQAVPIFQERVYFRGRDRMSPCLEISAVPILDKQGWLMGYRGVNRDVTGRVRAEKDLAAYQQKLRSLASELSLAEERERRRIATGLHDYACQNLVLSKMKLQGLREPLPPADVDEIEGVCNTLDNTVENVRGLIFDLSSPTLYKFGLEAALEELLEDKVKAQHGIAYTFHDDGAPKPLAEDVRVLLFQSVRELLINIIKHAQAHAATVDIARLDDSVQITVTDDGIGFDVADVLAHTSRNRGFGLFNIKERLNFIGGRLDIDSHRGQGSRFILVAHLEADATHKTSEGDHHFEN